MIITIKKKPIKVKYPFFAQRTSNYGRGRIILCFSDKKFIVIKNGENDSFQIGEELFFTPSNLLDSYSIIDEITFTTEYDYK